MEVKKHTSIWYSLDIEIEERKNLFDTLCHWGIISQVNVYTYWKNFENNRFELYELQECEIQCIPVEAATTCENP